MITNGTSLRTISPEGVVPECRMKDASATQSFVRRLVDNDSKRSYKRSKANGLVGGNPPYKASKLREAGRADAANVNWGTAASYCEASSGSFYDLSSEAPTAITFRTGHGTPEQRDAWSDLAAAEADKIIKQDKTWDYQMQISQWDMVLHGCGPMLFEDAMSIFPRATLCGDLKVPEMAKSETEYWETAMLKVIYYPAELYKFIQNDAAATAIGWNVPYVKKVIANAMNIQQQNGVQYEWEFFQQQLKNNSLNYMADDSLVCDVAHVFWQEFDGKITHAIVERSTTVGSALGVPAKDEKETDVQYLFLSVGRYANWKECVHPMYYDHGNGGYHHSVTGLGVKMYSAMEYENRLICNGCDKAFAPTVLFKPTTTTNSQKFSIARFGDFGVIPAGFDYNQTPVVGNLGDFIQMRAELKDIFGSVLSNYKSGVSTQKSGNPVTKFEKQMEAAMQSALSMPQYNRYYKQLDYLYAEIWRRLTNPNSTDKRAQEFQRTCKNLGIPQIALMTAEYVGATRVVGQGSAFMRKQAIDSVGAIVGSLPEEGRNRWISDKIAAEAGQAAVQRYNPTKLKGQLANDQQADAMTWVACMKVGIAPVITSTQNPVTFAATFMSAAVQAVNSLQKGGDPHEVLAFLEICGPAIGAYLRRFGQDTTRAQVHAQMLQQWKQLAQITDELKKNLMEQAQQQRQQQGKTEQAMTDIQIKNAKAKNDIAIKNAKTQHQLQQSDDKHKLKVAQSIQDMQLTDAKTAHEIRLSRMKSFAE